MAGTHTVSELFKERSNKSKTQTERQDGLKCGVRFLWNDKFFMQPLDIQGKALHFMSQWFLSGDKFEAAEISKDCKLQKFEERLCAAFTSSRTN